MLDAWRDGADVVYAVRESRAGETRFKLASARWFYRLFAQARADRARARLGRLPADGPRAARRAARDARAQPLPARHDRLGRLHPDRGRLPARGARRRQDQVHAREMLRFAFDAITSFSHAPLQAATLLGFVFSLLAFLAIPLTVVARYADIYVRGVPSTIVIILLLGGIQLITVGIIGEYVGPHLRRGQAPAAVRRARARQRRGAGPRPGRPPRGEDRRPRRRGVRAHRRPPAHARRPRGRRLRALARARRPGGDARRRRRPPARALLPPPVHVRPPHRRPVRRSSGCRTRSSGGRRASPSSPAARCTRSSRRSTCCASSRCRRPPACAWAPPCSRSSASPATRAPYERITARAWIERRMGRQAWARCGARCCAASSASAPTTSRWSGCGASCGCGAPSRARTSSRSGSATRGARGRRCSPRLARRSRPAAGAC